MQKSIPEQFRIECATEVQAQGDHEQLKSLTRAWSDVASTTKYSYHFEWMGRPIIQYPQDMIAMQEIIWRIRPDLIIETGIAHGGSIIYYASILELLGAGSVIGIDIDIRAHNRSAIEAHPMFKRIKLIEGSSIEPSIVDQVRKEAQAAKTVLVVLDSNHTHDHVLAELKAYAPLTSVGSYCVVMDTVIALMKADAFPDRPWGHGDNPKTAVDEYVQLDPRFEIDGDIDNKLLISMAPGGYLRRSS